MLGEEENLFLDFLEFFVWFDFCLLTVYCFKFCAFLRVGRFVD